jgi:hypothetical protein
VSVDAQREEGAGEYARLVETGSLAGLAVPPPPAAL